MLEQEKFDVETSKELARAYFKDEFGEYELEEILLQNQKGKFFILRDFRADYADWINYMRADWVRENKIEYIDEDEVKKWLRASSNGDVYKSLFGTDIQDPPNIKILYFRIMGGLQHWPEPGRYSATSSKWPTKSGICESIIGRAMGIPFESEYIGSICEEIEIGMKQAYNNYQPVFVNHEPNEHDAMNIWEEYLVDSCFLIAITCDEDLLEAIYDDMREPKKEMCLGHPECVPSAPIIPHITDEYSSIEDALTYIPLLDMTETTWKPESEPGDCEIIQYDSKHGELRNDVRIYSEDDGTEYTTRHVVTKTIG